MRDLVSLGEDACRRFARRPLFGEKHGDRWVWITYAELQQKVDALRGALAKLGVGKGDVVAMVSANRVAWAVAAFATYGRGAVFVPMYEEQQPDEWRYILADCGAKVVFAGTPAIAAQLEAMHGSLPELEHVLAAGADDDTAPPVAAVHPAPVDTACIIYTSGTTGRPKGVVLSHDNLVSNIEATIASFPIRPEDRTLSFLPWAHVYGQVVELYILMASGASSALNDRIANLKANLREIRPTILVGVPRIFHRIHAGVNAELATRPRFIRALFRSGLHHAARAARGERLDLRARIVRWLADRLLFSRIRARFGGRLRYAFSASAALLPEVATMIDAIGLPVYEGYGLTETSPVVSTNRPGARRLGSVGQPVPGVRVAIDQRMSRVPGEGEIIVYGPNVMQGYHHRPEETARTFTEDGGLRTGDLGRVDEDGYLYITGRIKEQYKLENGKYVMPGPLEQELALSPYVRAVLLYGANKPHNVALVVVEADAIRRWADAHHIDLGDLTIDPHVEQLIADEMAARGAEFRAYERPRGFVLTTHDFTVEDGTLTPSQKLKRNVVIERYHEALEALYLAPPLPLDAEARREEARS